MASYANLTPGTTNDPIRQEALVAAGLSPRQAEEFAKHYPTVLTQFTDTETSFSATVFKDASGNLTLAIRGTLEAGDFLPTDADIGLHGAGYDQILAMHNWWLRASSIAGQMVQQFALNIYPTGAGPAAAVYLYTSISVDPFGNAVSHDIYLEAAAEVLASGELSGALALDPDQRLDITGHSLGGHLAMAFGTLFRGATHQVTVFNAPGFTDTTANQQFFEALGGAVPTGTNTTNVIADQAADGEAPWSGVAGLRSRPGTAVDVAIEDQFGSDSDEPDPAGARNHSQQILTDGPLHHPGFGFASSTQAA